VLLYTVPVGDSQRDGADPQGSTTPGTCHLSDHMLIAGV